MSVIGNEGMLDGEDDELGKDQFDQSEDEDMDDFEQTKKSKAKEPTTPTKTSKKGEDDQSRIANGLANRVSNLLNTLLNLSRCTRLLNLAAQDYSIYLASFRFIIDICSMSKVTESHSFIHSFIHIHSFVRSAYYYYLNGYLIR